MCGRYTLFTDREQKELYEIIHKVDEKLNQAELRGKQMKTTGDVYPTDLVPVLVGANEAVTPDAAVWGFPHFQRKGVIINARADTAPEKRLFAKPFQTMRCVVPSAGFYEWDPKKEKYLFTRPDDGVVYMAGLANIFQDEKRFVILTTDANASMKAVHHRMPVILDKPEIEQWLCDDRFAMEILKRVPMQLLKKVVKIDETGQLHF